MDKIVCFGKNYQDHTLELGDKPVDILLRYPATSPMATRRMTK